MASTGFYREFHCNPHEYAEHPVPLRLFVPYGAKYKALRKDSTAMEKVKHIYIQTIENLPAKLLSSAAFRLRTILHTVMRSAAMSGEYFKHEVFVW